MVVVSDLVANMATSYLAMLPLFTFLDSSVGNRGWFVLSARHAHTLETVRIIGTGKFEDGEIGLVVSLVQPPLAFPRYGP